MKAIASAVRAMEKRAAKVREKIKAVDAKKAPLDAELQEIMEALELMRPLAAKNGGAGKVAVATSKTVAIADAERRWRAGDPPTQIAREMNLAISTLYQWRDKYGWPKKPGKAA